jgi:hypothetical protein
MSSRLVIRLALAVAMARTGTAHAQVPARQADSLLQRIRVLDSAMLARGRTVDSIRRSLVRPVPPADVRQGPLHVRTEPDLEPRVREADDSVVQLIQRRGGAVVAERAAAHVVMVTRDSTRSIFGMLPTIAITADTTRRWSMIPQRQVRGGAHGPEIADALGAVVEQLAMQGADSALSAWIMVGRSPVRAASVSEGADAYVELATTESIALRRCRARDVAACLDALGIDSLTGNRLTRWYAPEDYRAVTRVVAPPRDDSVAVTAWLACREHRDDAGCRIAVRAIPDARVPLPLSASVRFTFLREVLDAGGAGSFDRLVAGSGSIRDRLAGAANEPLDRTVLRWLERLERSRPDRMHVAPELIIASLGWTVVILGLPLIRRASWA